MGKSKDELLAEAASLGLTDYDDLNRDELAERVDEALKAQAAVGPVVPEGATEPVPPEATGTPITGVQPVVAGDIPEAGR